ncbi:MAG: hypothetical protein OEX02_13025, partial [Cyclobacteriaceae bacterium]|nr:hypothetical protein [Cyclobacteriaceae bacterium]
MIKPTLTYVLLALGLTIQCGLANDKDNTISVYPATVTTEGVIGATEEDGADNPLDNIFHVQIDRPLCADEAAWLVYEVYGVAGTMPVARSINDQLSTGGYLVGTGTAWQQHRERVDVAWLREGDNVVRFTLPGGAGYRYRVRGVKVETQKGATATWADRDIVAGPGRHANGQVYISGFITGQDKANARVLVGGKEARLYKGGFEALVPYHAGDDGAVDVEVRYADGQSYCRAVEIEKEEKTAYTYPLERTISHAEELFSAGKEALISLEGARLEAGAGALGQSATLTVTSLRDRDIPALDAGMVNVTKYHHGYRFLPHGTIFGEEVNLYMAYDEEKIPDGYTAEDVRTYYFDESTHHWVALPRDTILMATGEVQSRTWHFTDMINGIIKVPESPDAQAYNSTSMKGIKAANPTAGLNLINPPSANNTGNAAMSYPLNIPAGRAGMQPQLGLSYNSGGGNGWLGLGWNIMTPAITVDTRWGAPRYDDATETETYSLNGEMLTPVAHRGTPESRNKDGEKQFYPRVEGSFQKIIRKGNNPQEYRWIVTDKSGTKYFYGSTQTGILNTEAVLATDAGNIAHWALTRVEDLSGNYVSYSYETVTDTGNPSKPTMGVPGRQLYLREVRYTGHGADKGDYSVVFTRRAGNRRKDITINARYGFKQVTADLLEKIEVRYDDVNIRHYVLNYGEGAFYKTLLENIEEYDANGDLFSTHTFGYFDEVDAAGGYVPFENSFDTWNAGSDDIKGGFLDKGIFNDKASALSGNSSESIGAGMAVTVGANDGKLWSKSKTAGINYSYSRSKTEGELLLVDINGDGLPDKVMAVKDGKVSKMVYRPQLPPDTGGSARFGSARPVHGVGEFLKEKSVTNDFGLESHFIIFAGLNKSFTKSTTSVYLTDANGDGLIDIVKDGRVWFNHLNEEGDPVFEQDSRNTPNQIFPSGNNVSEDLITVDPGEIEQLIDQNPLHDVVRVWRAPFSGKIDIEAPVSLVEDISEERQNYTTADGVRVVIQLKGDELWSTSIGADDYSLKVPTRSKVSNLNVKKGDRVYFRVQSIEDGAYDQVIWAPTISYRGEDKTITDANGKTLYEFSAMDDYVVASNQTVGVPIDGKMKIEGRFIKPVTSDDVIVEIRKNGQVLFSEKYNWNEEVDKLISPAEETVDQGDDFSFKVISETNIDWNKISWVPYLYYTESFNEAITEVKQGNKNLIEVYGVPEYSIYQDPLHITEPWVADEDDTVSVKASIEFNSTVFGNLVFSVKKDNELVGKSLLTVKEGVVSVAEGSPQQVDVIVKKGDKLYLEYHTADRNITDFITKADGTLSSNKMEEIHTAGLHTVAHEDLYIYGHMYRGWGQFAYNGNRERASKAIDESKLNLDQFNDEPEPLDLSSSTSEEEMEQQFDNGGGFDASKNPFVLMYAKSDFQAWYGNDNLTYISKDTISSSRMGLDDLYSLLPEKDGTASSGFIPAVSKISKSNSTSLAANVGPLGGNGSKGQSKVITDYTDMNGDRYPDMLGEYQIQYTNGQGGLEEKPRTHGYDLIHDTRTLAGGLSVGGGFPMSKAEASNSPETAKMSVEGVSASLSGSVLFSRDSTMSSWLDINGDGLPDRVDKERGVVALNLGYSFAQEEYWGDIEIRKGAARNLSGSLGVNIGNGSIVAGVAYSNSNNRSKDLLQDVNGDGLVDQVYLDSNDQLRVNFNTGSGFVESNTQWGGLNELNKGVSTNRSANVAFTIGFPIVAVKLCINPKVINYSQGYNRQKNQMSDIDGDGFPDYVESDTDNELRVRRSTIGRTNMLQSVSRPLGGNITLDYHREGNTY